MRTYVVFESSSGYGVFEAQGQGFDEIGENTEAVKNSVTDLNRFGKVVKMIAFQPFVSAHDALNQCNAISEGIMTDELRNFLELTFQNSKTKNFILGVADSKLGASISEHTKIKCRSNEFILELLRGIRLHFDMFIKDLKPGDLEKAQLGLGHGYSRAKVKFNVNRVDNMVIQAIFLLDTLDKDINSISMRVREWYSLHFPELVRIVNDNYLYAKVAKFINKKSELSEEKLPALIEIVGDEDKAKDIVVAAKASWGIDLSPVDLITVQMFAKKVVNLAEYRKNLYDYLVTKMNDIVPNLSSLIGEIVGARLISHAGSLTNLAKCPSSTLQILGAEKALFRALKTRGNTPKHGKLFYSSFIGRASSKNKGRIARFLANKCSIASRIDCFSEKGSSVFGEKLREQVEERLDFYEKGGSPKKNIDVMKAAIEVFQNKGDDMDLMRHPDTTSKKSKKRKSKDDVDIFLTNGGEMEDFMAEKKKKKEKKKQEEEDDHEAKSEKKKKKKKKKEKRRLEQEADLDLNGAKEEGSIKKKKSKDGEDASAISEGKKKKKLKNEEEN